MRPGSSTEEKIALEQMRGKLLRDIEKFHKDARNFLSQGALRDFLSVPSNRDSLGAQWDSIEESSQSNTAQMNDGEDEPRVLAPEHVTIALPSTLGAPLCNRHGLSKLLKQERQLRVGQMNDALHQVRVGVGLKSLLYRTEVRQATSQRQKLRSYDDVHLTDTAILAAARLYDTSRVAMGRLYDTSLESEQAALDVQLQRYQVLRKGDLKSNTALIEHSVRGVSDLHLPWFWTLSAPGESRSGSWDEESACSVCLLHLYVLTEPPTIQCTV